MSDRTVETTHVPSEPHTRTAAQSNTLSASRMPSPEAVIAASRIAVRRALSIHRALGISAAVIRDGKIFIIPPYELPLEANDPSTHDPDETFGEYVPRPL